MSFSTMDVDNDITQDEVHSREVLPAVIGRQGFTAGAANVLIKQFKRTYTDQNWWRERNVKDVLEEK